MPGTSACCKSICVCIAVKANGLLYDFRMNIVLVLYMFIYQ